MASGAHCAYCFECLSASLEKRKPMSMQLVEELWEKYDASDEELEAVKPEDDGEEMEGTEQTSQTKTANGRAVAYRPAAISRLIAPSPSSASSSSSIPSATSSTPSLKDNTSSSATSKSSSRSSFFSSLPRRFGRYHKVTRSEHDEFPLFVTWNTVRKDGTKSLRGCIGTFEPQDLDDGLRNYALTSAFDDSRFVPINLREFSSLECGVTLLTDFETVSDAFSWEIGKHGLRISFSWNGRRYGATYLPDVAREQGWTKEETILSLMRKAGWGGKKEDWSKVNDMVIVRYQGRRATLGYTAWKEWRDWVEETGRDED